MERCAKDKENRYTKDCADYENEPNVKTII